MNVDMKLREQRGLTEGQTGKGRSRARRGRVLSTACVRITPRAFIRQAASATRLPSPALYFPSNSSPSLEHCLEAIVAEGRETGKMGLEWCEHSTHHHFQSLCLTGAQSLGHCHVHTSIPWGLLGELVHRILVSICSEEKKNQVNSPSDGGRDVTGGPSDDGVLFSGSH